MSRSFGRLALLVLTVVLAGCASSTQSVTAPATSATTVASQSAGVPSEITFPSIGFPSGSATTTSPAPSVTATAPATGPTDVRKVGDAAAFSSPSGRIICYLGLDAARCDFVGDKAWTAAKPAGCELDWQSTLVVVNTAGAGCVGDTVIETAVVGSEWTTWRRAGDPTVVVYDMTMAVLPYGSALASGVIRCESATSGVTCRNTSTGHGFTMAREAYSIF